MEMMFNEDRFGFLIAPGSLSFLFKDSALIDGKVQLNDEANRYVIGVHEAIVLYNFEANMFNLFSHVRNVYDHMLTEFIHSLKSYKIEQFVDTPIFACLVTGAKYFKYHLLCLPAISTLTIQEKVNHSDSINEILIKYGKIEDHIDKLIGHPIHGKIEMVVIPFIYHYLYKVGGSTIDKKNASRIAARFGYHATYSGKRLLQNNNEFKFTTAVEISGDITIDKRRNEYFKIVLNFFALERNHKEHVLALTDYEIFKQRFKNQHGERPT